MKRIISACLGLAVLCLASCKRDEEIKVYKVAKAGGNDAMPPAMEAGDAPAPAGDPHAGLPGVPPVGDAKGDPHAGLSAEQLAAAGGGGGPKVTDQPPSHWVKQAGSSMRQASYRVTGDGGASLDISLIVLRGAAGGTLDNVNRWRSQLGQPAVDQAALDASSTKLATAVGEAVVVDIEGQPEGTDAAKDGRIIGAITNVGGDAWFYKLRGNAALAAKEKENFLQWVASVKGVAGADSPAGAGGAAAAPAAPAAPAARKGPTWQLPAGWAEAAGSSARYATLSVTGADGAKAELAVTTFPGDVGGDLANVNRWRQQIGADPVGEAELANLVTKVQAGDLSLSMIDVTGPQNRLLAGWVRHGAGTWFFKLAGPEALLGVEKEKFVAFLSTVRFSPDDK